MGLHCLVGTRAAILELFGPQVLRLRLQATSLLASVHGVSGAYAGSPRRAAWSPEHIGWPLSKAESTAPEVSVRSRRVKKWQLKRVPNTEELAPHERYCMKSKRARLVKNQTEEQVAAEAERRN